MIIGIGQCGTSDISSLELLLPSLQLQDIISLECNGDRFAFKLQYKWRHALFSSSLNIQCCVRVVTIKDGSFLIVVNKMPVFASLAIVRSPAPVIFYNHINPMTAKSSYSSGNIWHWHDSRANTVISNVFAHALGKMAAEANHIRKVYWARKLLRFFQKV